MFYVCLLPTFECANIHVAGVGRAEVVYERLVQTASMLFAPPSYSTTTQCPSPLLISHLRQRIPSDLAELTDRQ